MTKKTSSPKKRGPKSKWSAPLGIGIYRPVRLPKFFWDNHQDPEFHALFDRFLLLAMRKAQKSARIEGNINFTPSS